jgi:hypothetical protein
LDGRILIETGRKEEIDGISTNITEKCGKSLKPRFRNSEIQT